MPPQQRQRRPDLVDNCYYFRAHGQALSFQLSTVSIAAARELDSIL
jgi:hypothetical protein